jgi:hypothetical protein
MQANLFKILAITAAFSTVQSAPLETAEGQLTQGRVNGTQTNEAHKNEADVNVVRALLERFHKNSYNTFYRFSAD